ncbi:MAG: hypothetical protein LAO55_27615 [Acidobacteriia bacterium]|nr:hypothetical protein [Terriglobia bacterium]
MATTLTTPHNLPARSDGEFPHRLRLSVAILAAASLIVALSIWGFDYYRLDLAGRAESPLHPMLRPSGSVGLRLGMLGIALYAVLFLYPIRKRWRWLGSIGKTRHWLDFHVLVGITAPILITFHASFKLRGLAGMAYWIMMAVALSGFIGRYMYAQIPRSLNADQIAFGELEQQAANLALELERQELFRPEEVAPLLNVPSAKEIRAMPLVKVLATLIRLDLSRPFLVSRLRRRVLGGSEILTTLGGFRRSSHYDLETVIASVRRQSWLRTKMAFLERTHQVFHLWHVVHRPFSYSFAALVVVHVTVVLMMGYY